MHIIMFEEHYPHPLSLVEFLVSQYRQVFWLMYHHPVTLPGFPVVCVRTPQLQRRDRVGLKPTSLLSGYIYKQCTGTCIL